MLCFVIWTSYFGDGSKVNLFLMKKKVFNINSCVMQATKQVHWDVNDTLCKDHEHPNSSCETGEQKADNGRGNELKEQ